MFLREFVAFAAGFLALEVSRNFLRIILVFQPLARLACDTPVILFGLAARSFSHAAENLLCFAS